MPCSRWMALSSACFLLVVSACGESGKEAVPLEGSAAPISTGLTEPAHQAHQTPRAVRLQDGRVLVADSALAEVYDPASNAWTVTGPRNFPSLTANALSVLADGRVMSTGGEGGSDLSYQKAAEILDPATLAWSPAAPMTFRRGKHSMVRLLDGRVLVVGGYSDSSSATATAEVYDPVADVWTVVGPAHVRHANGAAVLLQDGRVLVSGYGQPEVFDPLTSQFTVVGFATLSRLYGGAALLPTGKVLLFGGTSDTTELFDPAVGDFAPAASLAAPTRWNGAWAALPDGRVAVAGGYDCAGSTLSSVEVYDPFVGTWSLASPLLVARENATLVPLTGNLALVVGGAYRLPPPNQNVSHIIGSDQVAEVIRLGTCTPDSTCSQVGATCGKVLDGCGGTLECGTCGAGLTCTAGVCVEGVAPTVQIISPADGTIVGGTVQINVSASDNVGVTRAALYVESTKVGELAGPGPYSFSWNTTNGFGSWSILARAYDAAGNMGKSASVTVTQVNPYASYDATLKVPRCPVTADCRSGLMEAGRYTFGPESNSPNTIGRTCFDGALGTYHGSITGGESLDSLRVHSLDGGPLSPGKVVEVEAVVWGISSSDVLSIYSAPVAGEPVWRKVAQVSPAGSGSSTLRATFTLPSGSLQAIRGQFGLGAQSSACSASPYVDHDDLVFGVQMGPDRTAPRAAIGAPGNGATLIGPVTVTATATDDVGVVRIELYLDGTTRLMSWLGASYSMSWDPRTVSAGSHQLTVRAVDAAGNVGQSAPVTVNVIHDTVPPSVSFLAPSSDAVLSGTATLTVSASDDYGVMAVGFYLDGSWIGSSYQPPTYPFSLSTITLANGAHTLEARVSDLAGNVGTARVPVTFANDRTPPVVSVIAPEVGATVSGTVALQASASDDVEVTKVEFYVDGALVASATAAPYSVGWNSGLVSNGSHSVTARAYDAAQNIGTSAAAAITVANAGPVGAASYDATLGAPRCAAADATCDSAGLLRGRASLGPESNQPNTLSGACLDGPTGTFHFDESLDRLQVSTLDGLPLASGKTVRIDATVWVWGASSDRLDLYSAADARSPSWSYLGTLTPGGAAQQTLSMTFVLPSGSVQAIRGVFRYGGSASLCGSGSYDDQDDLVFAVQ